MAKAVIHLFEMVQVQQQHCHFEARTLCPLQLMRQAVHEECTVGQLGQRVGACRFLDALDRLAQRQAHARLHDRQRQQREQQRGDRPGLDPRHRGVECRLPARAPARRRTVGAAHHQPALFCHAGRPRMKLLAVTATRAEWGLLAPVLDALRGDARFTPQLLVTGQHLVAGSTTLAAITAEGHQPAALIDMELGADDGPRAISHSMGLLVDKVGKVFADLAPDAVLLLGDRYESLAVALAALVARIPVMHVFGGDVTEGAFDDSIRHAITKLAALHFVSNEESAARVRQLGEDPARVHNVGSTGIDRILAIKTLSRADFFQAVGLRPRDKNFVLTFHPATLVEDPAEEARALLAAIVLLNAVIVGYLTRALWERHQPKAQA